MAQTRERSGWFLVENFPDEMKHRVLLLPGLLCTDEIYADVLADRELEAAGIRLAAGNPPGFKGTPAPPGFDYAMESYAALVEELAEAEGYDLLVGHSLMGNVLIEVAARRRYRGRLLLVSPSLHRSAEPNDTRTLDSLSRKPVLSGIAWWLSYRMARSIFKTYFTEERRSRLDAVVGDVRRTPRQIARRILLAFFDHMDRHGGLLERLLSTEVPTWYVRGADDNIAFEDAWRAALTAHPQIRVIDVPGSRHFAMLDRPRELNALIRELLAAPAAAAAAP